jgi:hypothetical protein
VNSLVFAFHCLIVFGVPPLFGWVLLRRVFREANLLALVPGAVVTGWAALMAAVNETRYFAEMGTAVWFSYKLLFALAALGLVVRPRPGPRPRLPGCTGRGWQLALLAAGAAGIAVYFGLPAFGGFLDDAWWGHYPAAVQIQTVERFPLSHMFAVDSPLYYHQGPDILAACWSYLLDRPVPTGFAINIVVLAPCAFLLSFALLARLARSFWPALLGAALLAVGGNLRFLLFLTGRYPGVGGALQVFNSEAIQGLLQLMFTPSHALGVPLVLTAVLLFRQVQLRPAWPTAVALGLLLGSATLVAEWYFLPLWAGVTLIGLRGWWRRRGKLRRLRTTLALALAPAVVAVFWGSFNNTYLSGMFGYFWTHRPGVEQVALARQYQARFRLPAAGAPEVEIFQPKWSAPDLVPLRFNFDHFGRVPSWKATGSNESSYLPILGPEFLMEATPVLLVGIPFGLLLARRRRNPALTLLAWLALVSALPPIFLDWGYRSTDLLRFFTAAFSFSALFLGWLAGDLLTRGPARRRWLGAGLGAACLANPFGLGVIGLMPHTIERVTAIADTNGSLSDSPAALAADQARHRAFEKLAVKTGDFLFLLAHGRERAVLVVPPDQLPKRRNFPEWMKFATLGRMLIPVGWYWEDSIYSAYYREAVTRLDASSLAALDAKWVITSNTLEDPLPREVASTLKDRTRFAPAAAFREGPYTMVAYRVLP